MDGLVKAFLLAIVVALLVVALFVLAFYELADAPIPR